MLPVRIHNLDIEDIKECEAVLGSYLRGVEFIYREAGVDKPLSPGDNERKNLNNTVYRIQIIRVAHAIKEIIQGMKAEPAAMVKEKVQVNENFKEADKYYIKEIKEERSGFRKRILIAVTILALVLLAVAGIIYLPRNIQISLKHLLGRSDI